MSSSRRIVRKVDLPHEKGFDTEFWPVVVAMSILAAICIGAILSLLDGIWMWASLMLLPGLVGVSLAVLRMVNHRMLRRSLQVAIIFSAAIHILLLVISCFWSIFSAYEDNRLTEDLPSKTKPIRITFRNEQPTWEPPEKEPEVTPDPKVEVEEKEQTEQPTEKKVTVVEKSTNSQNQTNNQRQSQQQPTVPKFGKTLAKLSRQPTKSTPQTSESSQASAAASSSSSRSESQPAKTEVARNQPSQPTVQKTRTETSSASSPSTTTQRTERSNPSPSKTSVAKSQTRPRQLQPQVEPNRTAEKSGAPGASLSRVQAQTAQPSSAAMVNRKTTETKPEVARQTPRTETTQQTPSKTSVTRTERTQPRPTPTLSQPTPQIQRNRTAQKPITSPPTPTQTAKTQTQVTNRSTTSRQIEIQKQVTSNVPQQSDPRRSSSSSTNVAERKPMEQTPRRETSSTPSLPKFAENQPQPRRTQMASPQVQSPQNMESPSMAKTNQTQGSSQMSPRPLALSKAETGTAGTGSSANFERAQGPAVSPAKTASNSSKRSQSQSRENQTQSLASRQRSQVNRSITGAPVPQQVVKTDSDTGSVSGTPTPKSMTASSSASIQSSSANQNRGEMSADKGSASIDIGPQKIVADQSSSRTGGGGQPQISQQSITSPSRNDGSGPALSPMVATTNPSSSATAPLTQGTAPNRNSNTEPNSQSSIAQRESDSPITIGDPSQSRFEVSPSKESIAGNGQQTRSQQNSTSSPSMASNDSDSNQPSDRDNRLNRMIANLPSETESGSTGQINSNDPSAVNSNNAIAANTAVEKQSQGTLSSDRARSGDLVQANADDSGPISNSSSRRNRPIGADHESEMVVGQSNRNNRQLSPMIGGEVGDETGETRVAKSPGSGSGTGTTPSRAVDVVRSASNLLPSSNVGPATTQLLAAAASHLPPVQNGRKNGPAPSRAGTASIDGKSSRGNNPRAPMVESNSENGQVNIASTGQNPNSTSTTGSAQVADAEKQSNPGMEFDIEQVEGPGGLETTPDRRVGINSIRASRDSDTIQPQPLSRFRRKDVTGVPNVLPAEAIAKTAFGSRRRKRLRKQSPQTAKAIELGLAFLAKQQNDDGSWSLDKLDKNRKESEYQMISDTAATGLSLLAFQGAGFSHKEFYYSEKMNRAVNWLKENQAEDGNLYVSGDERSNKSCQLYSHAIATLALCEAYGMTQDPELQAAAQKAIDFIVRSQDKRLGGWRYYSAPVSMQRSDTSVTGWMVMALQSARLAGLKVDDKAFGDVEKFLGFAKDTDKDHLFRYNPNANANNPKTRNGLEVTHSMTSVGLLMRMYLGWDRDDQRLIKGADYLLTRLPDDSSEDLRDTYYWYYATQVMNHVGGEHWKKWNEKLEPLLIQSQVQNGKMAGSWDPYYPVADRWSRHGGRIYLTAMNLLNLEVEYRKLPIYDDTSK